MPNPSILADILAVESMPMDPPSPGSGVSVPYTPTVGDVFRRHVDRGSVGNRIASTLATALRLTPLGDVASGAAQGVNDLGATLALAAGQEDVARDFRARSQESEDAQALVSRANPAAPEWGARMLRGASRSLATSIPGAVVGGPAGAIASGMAVSGGGTYLDRRDDGASAEEALAAALRGAGYEGLPAAIMQRFGLGGMESMLADAFRRGGMPAVREIIKRGARAGVQEIPEELVATNLDLADQALTTDRQFSAGDVLQANVDTAAQAFLAPNLIGATQAAPIIARDLSTFRIGTHPAELAARREVERRQQEAVLAEVPEDAAPDQFIGDRRAALMADVAAVDPDVLRRELESSAIPTPPSAEGLDPAADLEPLPALDHLLSITPTEVGNLARLDRSAPETEQAPTRADIPAEFRDSTTGAVVPVRRPDVRPDFRATTAIDVPVQEVPRAEAAPPAAPRVAPGPVPGAAPPAPGAAPAPAPVARQPQTPAAAPVAFQTGQRVRVTKGKRAGLEATIASMSGNRPILRTDDGKTLGGTAGITPSNLEIVPNAQPAPAAPNAGTAPVEAPRPGPVAAAPPAAQPQEQRKSLPGKAGIIQRNIPTAKIAPEATDVRPAPTPPTPKPAATPQPAVDAGRERVPGPAVAAPGPVDNGPPGAAAGSAEPAPAPVPPVTQSDRTPAVVPPSPVNTGENAPTTGEKASAAPSSTAQRWGESWGKSRMEWMQRAGMKGPKLEKLATMIWGQLPESIRKRLELAAPEPVREEAGIPIPPPARGKRYSRKEWLSLGFKTVQDSPAYKALEARAVEIQKRIAKLGPMKGGRPAGDQFLGGSYSGKPSPISLVHELPHLFYGRMDRSDWDGSTWKRMPVVPDDQLTEESLRELVQRHAIPQMEKVRRQLDQLDDPKLWSEKTDPQYVIDSIASDYELRPAARWILWHIHDINVRDDRPRSGDDRPTLSDLADKTATVADWKAADAKADAESKARDITDAKEHKAAVLEVVAYLSELAKQGKGITHAPTLTRYMREKFGKGAGMDHGVFRGRGGKWVAHIERSNDPEDHLIALVQEYQRIKGIDPEQEPDQLRHGSVYESARRVLRARLGGANAKDILRNPDAPIPALAPVPPDQLPPRLHALRDAMREHIAAGTSFEDALVQLKQQGSKLGFGNASWGSDRIDYKILSDALDRAGYDNLPQLWQALGGKSPVNEDEAAPATPAPETGGDTAPSAPEQPVPEAAAPNPEQLPAVGARVRVAREGDAAWTGTVVSHIDQARAMVKPDDAHAVPVPMRPRRGSDVGVHARFLSVEPQAEATATPKAKPGQSFAPERRLDGEEWPTPASDADVASVPPVALRGDELHAGDEIGRLRKAAEEHMESLRGDSVVNDHSGRAVMFGKNSVRKPISGPRKLDELRAIAAIPETIKRGLYVGSEPGRNNENTTIHRLHANVVVDGRPYIAVVVLREQNGVRFYDQHFLIERATPAARTGDPQARASDEAASPSVAPTGDTAGADASLLEDRAPGKQPAPERTARGRIPVAPIAPTAASDADRVATSIAGAMTKLRDEFRARGVGDPQLAAGETPKGAGGMFDEATGVATLYRSNDLDTAAHELGHQVAWKFGIDTEDVPGETDFFAKTGSQAPPNLTGRDLRDYRAKEAWAEFVRAWIVNPEVTEAQAPRMTDAYKRAVPEAVRSALADFGRFGREFLGLPPAARTQANIEQTEVLIEAGSTVRAVASMFNLGEAMAAARGERGAWAKLSTFLAKAWKSARVPLAPPGMRSGAMSTDEIKAYREALKSDNGGRWAAFRWQWQNVWFPAYDRFAKAYEIRGRDVKPENDFRILNRLLAGTDGKVLEAVFGSGLRDSRNRPVVDEATGEALTLPWLLNPISTSVDRETGEMTASTPGAFVRLVNKAMAYGVELRTFGRGSKLLEQADKDAQRFVDDLDAFINGTADMGVLDSIEQRWKDAGLDPAQGTKLRVIAARLTKMIGGKARAPDARGLRKFTEEYGRKVRDMAAEKAARISGIGAGLTSDYRQAEQALRGRESDPDKPAMDEFLRRYRRWAQHLIQYLQETGVYSEDQAKKMLESDTWTNPETGEQLDFYLDMHRLIERDGTSIMPGRRFTGSTKTVRNPLANLLEATLNAIASGDRNRAMLALADAFRNRTASGEIADDVRDSRLGEWGRQVPEDAVQQARASGQNTVNGRIPYVIKNNGVKEFWTFDPWVEASIEAARRQGGDGNLLLRLWATATRIMRTGITTFPSFMLRNLARDLQVRVVASETAKGTGLADVWRGFGGIETAGRRERVDALRKVTGASYAGYNDGRVQIGQALAQHLDSLIRPTLGGKAARVVSPQTLMRAAERLNEWFEAVNRNAELASAYRDAKAKGMDDFNAQLYAADKARGLIDFAEAGVYSRQLNRAILFINPAIQGLARFFRTWDLVAKRAANGASIPERVARVLTARATVAMGLMTAAALAVRSLKDDDEEEKWRQQDPTVRDFHWHIPISGGPDLAVPRPYDWGFVLAGAERLADAVMAAQQGNERQVKRAMDGFAKSAMGALLPINDVSSLLGGFAPIVEAGFNYDPFRQRHIIPTWDEGADLRLRDTDRASAIGKVIQSVTGQDARLIDHIIEGYAGNWGRAATSVGKPADWWMGTLTGMFKADPAGAARDVQWVYDEASRLRVGSSPAVRNMTKMLKEARNAPTAAERERLAERARKYAAGVRNAWEKNPPKVLPEK